MDKYIIYANGEPIGESRLENCDSSMGCFYGVFLPNGGYAKIRDVIIDYSSAVETQDKDISKAWQKVQALNLVVATESGEKLEAAGGVSLVNFFKASALNLGDCIRLAIRRILIARHASMTQVCTSIQVSSPN